MILLRRHWLEIFHVQCCLEPRGQHSKCFYLHIVVPRVLRQHWIEFFLCNVFWSLLDNNRQSFYLSNVVPIVLRHHWILFFPMHCYLEPLGQHCTRFLPVQYGPKSIKATLNRILFRALLSGASRTTLHREFTCVMLSQEC